MSLSITTYNILANAYLNSAWYPNSAAEALDPSRRVAVLLDYLAKLDADILCLQEVEAEVYGALSERLTGYQGVFEKKSGGKPDGCATLLKKELPLQRSFALRYPDDTGHLALFVITEHEDRRLGVVSTHLRWDPPGTAENLQVGRRQMLQLLDEIDRFVPRCQGWIVCGDLNATPESSLVRAAVERGWRDAYSGQPAETCNSNRVAKRIDFLFHTQSLSCRPRALREIDGNTPLPSLEEPSDHLAIGGRLSWKRDDAPF